MRSNALELGFHLRLGGAIVMLLTPVWPESDFLAHGISVDATG
jgi:hypothetical protein